MTLSYFSRPFSSFAIQFQNSIAVTSWQSVIDNWHRNVWKSLTLMSFSVPLSISWYHSIYATMQDMSTWHLKVAICPGLAVTLLIIFWMWGFPQVLTERKKKQEMRNGWGNMKLKLLTFLESETDKYLVENDSNDCLFLKRWQDFCSLFESRKFIVMGLILGW